MSQKRKASNVDKKSAKPPTNKSTKKKTLKPQKRAAEEEVDSGDEDRPVVADKHMEEEDEAPTSDAEEAADSKRLRLAKEYLREMKAKGLLDEDRENGDDSESGDEDVTKRLRFDIRRKSDKFVNKVASVIESATHTFSAEVRRVHSKSVTALAMASDDTFCVSGGKDCNIVHFDIPTATKTVLKGSRDGPLADSHHTGHVFAIALSDDRHLLASGGMDKVVRVWDLRSHTVVKVFKGHKDAVSALTFRKSSHDLYSASFDRSIKVWNLDEMAYVETLYGHHAEVLCLHSLSRERVLSGSRDSSIRHWKVPEETQQLFNGHTSSTDAVCMLAPDRFLSGSQDGNVCVWDTMKKKPTWTVTGAHHGKWITSVGHQSQSDLCASGSSDGFLNLYKFSREERKVEVIKSVPVEGFVNAIAFATSGRFVALGVGQEHRFGRWERIKAAKNGVHFISLPVQV